MHCGLRHAITPYLYTFLSVSLTVHLPMNLHLADDEEPDWEDLAFFP